MRRLGIMLAATAILTAGSASAASLDPGSAAIGSGGGAVNPCDQDGFALEYAVSSNSVTDVTVSDIADPGCEGGELSLVLVGSGAKLGRGGPTTVALDGDSTANSVTLHIPEQPAAADVDAVHVAVTGP